VSTVQSLSPSLGRDPKAAAVGARACAGLAPLTRTVTEAIATRWASSSWPAMADDCIAAVCAAIHAEAAHLRGDRIMPGACDDRLRNALVDFADAHFSAWAPLLEGEPEPAVSIWSRYEDTISATDEHGHQDAG
jgi:hypothetical protein